MNHAPPHAETAAPSWTDVFRGRFGIYLLLINIGILFFAVDNFLINTLMDEVQFAEGGGEVQMRTRKTFPVKIR